MADNLLVKDATGANVSVRMKDVGGGIETSMSIPTDTSGNAVWGTAGTANANVMTIQGVASMTPMTVNGAVSNASSAVATSSTNQSVVSNLYGWNGATWDQIGATSGVLNVGGNVASGVADAGNPVKVGAVFNSTMPSPSTGQRVDLQAGSRGSLRVEVAAGGNTGIASVNVTTADALGSPNALAAIAMGFGYNGTNFDRWRTNVDTAALITLTAAGAGTTNSADQTNYNGVGVQIGVNVTSIAVGTLTVTVQGKDIASGVYYTLLSSIAIAGTGFTNLTVYPGTAVTANVDASDVLPRTWRVSVVASAGITVSATVGASVILG